MFLFDPMIAIHASNVEPLPHQITAVYESGAGKTVVAGSLIGERACRTTLLLDDGEIGWLGRVGKSPA